MGKKKKAGQITDNKLLEGMEDAYTSGSPECDEQAVIVKKAKRTEANAKKKREAAEEELRTRMESAGLKKLRYEWDGNWREFELEEREVLLDHAYDPSKGNGEA